jgi:aldehyde:ferredoxin oxidoreductase
MPLDRKVAIINLTTGEIEIEPIPVKVREMFMGGRGIDAYLMYNHIPKGADPLGPDNACVISGGFLSGTLASATSRTHVGGKSPLTGYFGSCNGGGFFAPEMAFAGFHHLVIKGKAEKPVYIWVNNGKIEIRDAANIWGKDINETRNIIRQELNDRDIKVLTIGIGGENLVRYANVMTGIKNSGGRTGMGAILGSKNCKAIAARGTMDIKIAHPQEALEYNRRVINQITSTKVNREMGKIGTGFIWGATNSWGGIRTRNFRDNQLENSEDVEAEHLEELSFGMAACFGCQVHCRGKYVIKDGPYAGTYDEGPEYTSMGAFAAEPGCTKANTILVCNHLVNIYGIDTLETGSMIAWAMELFENGILTEKDTDGIDLRFGNDEAVIEMCHRIARREGLGDILAEGPLRAAEKIGKDSYKYLVQVKGMSNLNSDERATPALALNIAVASRGSDHLRGRPAIDLFGLPEPVLRKIYSQPVPYDGPLTSHWQAYEGKPWMVRWQETCFMAVDCLGICKYHTLFLGPNLPNFDEWSRLVYLNTGLEMSPLDIWNAADRAYIIERLFNIREGLTRKDDWLSDRYYDEPTTRGIPAARGKTIDREKFKKMIDEYYAYHGWDENGVPTPETLKKLGIDKEPSHML